MKESHEILCNIKIFCELVKSKDNNWLAIATP